MNTRVKIFRFRIWTSVLILVAIVFLPGCRKWSHNGYLDGMWQVMQVTYSDDAVSFPEGTRYYYNFYLHTFQLSTEDDRPEVLIGNMTYEEDAGKLLLDFPYIKNGRISKKWRDKLVYWGVPQSGEMDLRIRQLTSSRLVMEYDSVVIVCRKF